MQTIIDASVAVKWFVEEEDSKKAADVLDAIKENKLEIVVPDLLYYEIGSVLLKKKMQRKIKHITSVLINLNFRIKHIALLSFEEIYKNASCYSLSFYDASYVTLMQQENCEFVTADKKLYQKIRKDFPLAKLL